MNNAESQPAWTWKIHDFKSSAAPDDALRPACVVHISYSRKPLAEGEYVVDSDITEFVDWFYVYRYQAAVVSPTKKPLSHPVKKISSRVDWLFVGFVIFLLLAFCL